MSGRGLGKCAWGRPRDGRRRGSGGRPAVAAPLLAQLACANVRSARCGVLGFACATVALCAAAEDGRLRANKLLMSDGNYESVHTRVWARPLEALERAADAILQRIGMIYHN